MGTYKLLFDKGPISIPVVMLLLAVGSLKTTVTDVDSGEVGSAGGSTAQLPAASATSIQQRSVRIAPNASTHRCDPMLLAHSLGSLGPRFLRWLVPLHVIAWPVYILHIALDELLDPLAAWM
jgi:hypothetical protein